MPQQVVPVIGDLIRVVTIHPDRQRDRVVTGKVVQIVPASPVSCWYMYPGCSRRIRAKQDRIKLVLHDLGNYSVISYLPNWYSFTVLAHSDEPVLALIPVEPPRYAPIDYAPIVYAQKMKIVEEYSLPEPPHTIYDADF
jgi:hypothetical protein